MSLGNLSLNLCLCIGLAIYSSHKVLKQPFDVDLPVEIYKTRLPNEIKCNKRGVLDNLKRGKCGDFFLSEIFNTVQEKMKDTYYHKDVIESMRYCDHK